MEIPNWHYNPENWNSSLKLESPEIQARQRTGRRPTLTEEQRDSFTLQTEDPRQDENEENVL